MDAINWIMGQISISSMTSASSRMVLLISRRGSKFLASAPQAILSLLAEEWLNYLEFLSTTKNVETYYFRHVSRDKDTPLPSSKTETSPWPGKFRREGTRFASTSIMEFKLQQQAKYELLLWLDQKNFKFNAEFCPRSSTEPCPSLYSEPGLKLSGRHFWSTSEADGSTRGEHPSTNPFSPHPTLMALIQLHKLSKLHVNLQAKV